MDEDAPVEPEVNTRSALAAEAAAHRVTAAGGVGVVLRFALFYGPASDHTRDLLDAARRGVAGVLGDPAGFLPHVHLEDAATAVVAALHAPAGTYNVAEDEPVRRAELVEVLKGIAGRELRTPPGLLARIGAASTAARSVRMANDALRQATGWAPSHDVRQSLPTVAAQLAGTQA